MVAMRAQTDQGKDEKAESLLPQTLPTLDAPARFTAHRSPLTNNGQGACQAGESRKYVDIAGFVVAVLLGLPTGFDSFSNHFVAEMSRLVRLAL